MYTAHIDRLLNFAQHGQPSGYGGSDMMRADLKLLIDTKRLGYIGKHAVDCLAAGSSVVTTITPRQSFGDDVAIGRV